MDKNIEKYETYKHLSEALSKSMKSGFYYEAIFIEYAILEDRLTSVLKYAGAPIIDKSGRPWKISKKIDMIRSRKEFTNNYVRARLTPELLDSVVDWKRKRDALIHDLANTPYNSEAVKQVAEEGYEVVRVVKNKSRSVTEWFKKQNG